MRMLLAAFLVLGLTAGASTAEVPGPATAGTPAPVPLPLPAPEAPTAPPSPPVGPPPDLAAFLRANTNCEEASDQCTVCKVVDGTPSCSTPAIACVKAVPACLKEKPRP